MNDWKRQFGPWDWYGPHMTCNAPGTTSDQPTSTADPLEGEALRQALGEIPVGNRIEEAFSCYLLAGVSLGFARTAVPPLRQRAADIGKHPLSAALKHMALSLAHTAVLDAAATYDQAGEGSNSLANALDLITRHLQNPPSVSSGNRLAARKLVNDIRQSVINQKSEEIKALRYWRNKWAGHRTSDSQVDPWSWDHPLNFSTIAAGLEQMRAAFHEFALLLDQLPELAVLQDEAGRIDVTTFRVGISLEGTSSWPISVPIGIGEAEAQQFLDRALPALTCD